MPEKYDNCVEAVKAQGKSDEQAHAICTAQFKDSYRGEFRDAAVYNATSKTAVSVRDGVLEYSGAEIGMVPEDQIFTIYRSPATISNTAMKMRGLPVTDEHVPLDVPAPSHGGFVDEAKMVDAHDEITHTTIAIENRLAVSDTLLANVEAGRRELSLGYNAELVPHDVYDFEQRDIVPHHLATVDRGRCGSMCSFIDRKPKTETNEDPPMSKKTKLPAAFCDAEGEMNLQQIVELATALPEAIKSVPVDQLQELLPALKQIVEASKAVMTEEPAEEQPVETEDKDTPPVEEDKDMSDEDKEKQFADAVSKQARKFTDAAVKRHTQVIEKARDFVPEDYTFSDKSTEQIMRDALATDTTESFADSELDLAFKMLKKRESSYQNFGDSNPNPLAELGDKDI